ncbi:MAG: hypothetical protein WCB99_08930, partial [Candidatus Cybelea sp.]
MAQSPQSRYVNFPCSGVLTEAIDPAVIGGKALTDCLNLIYQRNGAWAKRPGNGRHLLPSGPTPGTPVSGVRWYKGFQNPQTWLVLYTQGQLLIGPDVSSLQSLGAFALSGNRAPEFCSMRDPQASGGQGSDILIITGLSIPNGSFGTGQIEVRGNVPALVSSSATITVTLTNGAATPIVTASYNILPTDNPASICAMLVQNINQSPAFLNIVPNPSPFVGQAYSLNPNPIQPGGPPGMNNLPIPHSNVNLGARHGGPAGNNINYQVDLTNWTSTGTAPMPVVLVGGVPITVTAGTGSGNANFTGGGQVWNGPLKTDGGNGASSVVEGLSYMCPNPFTGCATWHDHVWLWGDKANPTSVFACDILQPEAFTFMLQNGGMKGAINGGYSIGNGDGDPVVQACVPAGNG